MYTMSGSWTKKCLKDLITLGEGAAFNLRNRSERQPSTFCGLVVVIFVTLPKRLPKHENVASPL